MTWDEDSSLGSEVEHRVLLVAAGRDSQGILHDHFKYVQMGGGHLCDPDRDGDP